MVGVMIRHPSGSKVLRSVVGNDAADNVDRNHVRRRVYDHVASKETIIVADAMIDATEVLVAVDIPVTGTRQVERAVCCERLGIKIG